MAELTVLGIGNILMRDEGVGVRLLEAVQKKRTWPASVEFVDGGVGGLALLNVIESAKRMVVFDAAEMNLPPGEYRVITPAQAADEPAKHRVSMHDEPLTETLKLCEKFSHKPEEIRIMVIQPKSIDFGRSLTTEMEAALEQLTIAAEQLVADMAEKA